MEVPIKFDVWAKVTPGSENEIINLVREKSTYKSELEIRKVVNLSIISNEVIEEIKKNTKKQYAMSGRLDANRLP